MQIKLTKDDLLMVIGFIEESLELLDNIEERILDMESNYSVEIVNDIFRAIHTIKGTSSFLSLIPIKNLSHELEFLLDELRKGKRELEQSIVDILLKGSDVLKNLIISAREQIEGKESDTIVELNDYNELIDEIKNIINKETDNGIKVNNSPNTIEESNKIIVDFVNMKNADIEKDMCNQFKEETIEHLHNIETNLLNIETNHNDTESINELFRALHSIKGNTGLLLSLIDTESYEYFILSNLKEVAHKGESLLQKIRDNQLRFSPSIISIFFKTFDYISSVFDSFINRFKKVEINSNQEIIDLLTKSNFDKKDSNANHSVKAKKEFNPAVEGIKQFIEVSEKILGEWEIKKEFKTEDIKIFQRIINLLKLTSNELNDKLFDDAITKIEDTISLISQGKLGLKDSLAIDILKEKIVYISNFRLKISDNNNESEEIKKIGEILLEEGKIKEEDLDKALAVQKKQISSVSEKSVDTKSMSTNIETIRVRMDKLDKLMNDIGELVISKNSFYHIFTKLVQAEVVDIAKEFKEKMIMKIGRLAEELQNTIVQVRMIPVKTVFQKFPRMVRDLALKNNKKIKLAMEGEDTELDKTVIEKINDPLVHIIRNSCDHGIESPDERVKKQKEETGTIILKAEKKGNNVNILIIDDGKGIDIEMIKKKALERKIVTEEELVAMDEKAILNLIFMPGFSTAEKITEVSGRGVGMDVVKTNINKLKGSIDLETQKDIGSTIIIKIPLTLAITKGLSFKLSDFIYIIPIEVVEEIIKIKEKDIKKFKNKHLVNIRGDIIELLNLKKIYNIEDKRKLKELNVIIIKYNGMKIGLIVDSLEEELDMVVKPLPEYLSNLQGVGGGTILGDGMVAIVLEPSELFELL